MEPINVAEFERAAADCMSKMAFDYYASGAYDEVTLADNCQAYDKIKLHYRVLRDIGRRDLSATVLGERLEMPLFIAPTAFHRLAHDEGEVATVKAAGSRGIAFALSTLSTRPIEEVVEAASGPVWFQLYVYRDRELTRELVQRASAAGCRAILVTVDAQVFGVRERDVRNRFHLPEGLKAENLLGSKSSQLQEDIDGSSLGHYVETLFDPTLTWRDLEWLASITSLPVVVKGIVHPEDGRLAAAHGASAVVVSNHGGRQLDTAPATIDVLPKIVDAAGDQLEVWLDGGIRRGTDILKALAYGARAVGIGRPALWGLAVAGESGVGRVLDILKDELDRALGLCGHSTIDELGRHLFAAGE